DGLAGEHIPLLGRILAVADAYDAMSIHQPSREAVSRAEVEANLRAGAGTEWDGNVVAALLRCGEQVRLAWEKGAGDTLCGVMEGALRAGSSAVLAAGS